MFMKLFVTTDDIYQAARSLVDVDLGVDLIPALSDWHYTNKISIDKINWWEQIYFQPGNLGIYAAFDPYVEYFIIVPYFFVDCLESYYGSKASESVYQKAKEIGIDLKTNKVWIPLEKY